MNLKEKKWLKALIEITTILNDFQIQYFLDTGTLLGAIRDNAFIPWDNDIDLGSTSMPTKGLILKFSNEIYRLGYNVTSTKENISIKKCNTDVEVNIKFYKKDLSAYTGEFELINGNELCAILHSHLSNIVIFKKSYGFSSWINSVISKVLRKISYIIPFTFKKYLLNRSEIINKNISIPKYLIDDRISYEFYDNQFYIPKNFNEYLEHRYGSSWNIAVKDYNYLTDDKSII